MDWNIADYKFCNCNVISIIFIADSSAHFCGNAFFLAFFLTLGQFIHKINHGWVVISQSSISVTFLFGVIWCIRAFAMLPKYDFHNAGPSTIMSFSANVITMKDPTVITAVSSARCLMSFNWLPTLRHPSLLHHVHQHMTSMHPAMLPCMHMQLLRTSECAFPDIFTLYSFWRSILCLASGMVTPTAPQRLQKYASVFPQQLQAWPLIWRSGFSLAWLPTPGYPSST